MSPRERQLLFATIGVLLLALGRTLVISPFFERWRLAGEQQTDLTAAVERSEALATRLVDLRTERVALSAALEHADEAGAGAVPKILTGIRQLATRAGFEPLALRDVRREDQGAFRSYVFWLRARTDLASITRFLAEMKAAPGYLRVTSLSVSPQDGRGGTGSEVNADMVLVALAERDAERGTQTNPPDGRTGR